MKLFISSVFFLLSISANGQGYLEFSKKELQVEFQKKLTELESKNKSIKELTTTLYGLEKKVTELKIEKNEKTKEINSLEFKANSLKAELNTSQVKVKEVVSQNNSLTEYLNKNTPIGLQTNFKQFLNPSHQEIGDFLAQFEEETSFRQEVNGESLYFNRTFELTTFKNGISFEMESGYEYSNYTLFLPLNLTEELKNGLERLCKNMGGCLSPEEVEVSYAAEKNGLKISWGGGC